MNGKKIKFFDLTDPRARSRRCYQLLPVYPCYDDGGGTLLRVDRGRRSRTSTRRKAKAALRFHMEIRTAVEQHLKDQEYLDNRYDIRPDRRHRAADRAVRAAERAPR